MFPERPACYDRIVQIGQPIRIEIFFARAAFIKNFGFELWFIL